MKNYVQHGHVLELTAPSGGVVSGNGYLIGAIFGVAVTSEAQATPFQLQTVGVFSLPKLSAQAWTEGAKIYWDASESHCTTVSTDNTLIGVAAAAAANPSATGNVRLGIVA